MILVEYIQVITLIITSLGVIVALIFSLRQSYLMRQQMKVNLFAEFTKRYQEIVVNLPEEIHDDGFNLYDLREENKSLYNKTMRYMRVYFDLCSEEYYLHENNLISKRVWKEWKEGIEYTFQKKPFLDAWNIITTKSKFYDEFAVWVSTCVTIKPQK
jgi:hypothetical protein